MAERHGRALLVWGLVGLLAQLAFTAGWVIAETWQGPRYSPLTDTISDMQAATAPHVWFILSCFAIGGVGTFCFAIFGLRPALSGLGRLGTVAAWVVGCCGLALGNSFPLLPCGIPGPGCTATTQLMSPGGLTDAIVSSLGFVVLVFTPALLRRPLAAIPAWGSLRPVVRAAQFACPAAFTLLGVSYFANVDEGLCERILAAVCVLWLAALAATLIRISRRDTVSPRPEAVSLPAIG